MSPETRLVAGLVALAAAFADVAVGVYLLLQPPAEPEMVRCPRCGKLVLVEAVTYHRRRCSGLLRSMPVASALRRRW